jgi:hypothetical protein
MLPFLRSQSRKCFVEEQRKRFGDITNYRTRLSDGLHKLRDDLTEQLQSG